MIALDEFTLGAVQAAPVYFDREASTEKACRLIREAGTRNVDLLAFSESWLPGYPFFDRIPLQLLDEGRVRYLTNAVEIPSPTTDRLCDAASHAGTDVVIGVAELDQVTKSTTYCTLLFIGREGRVLGRHRKLMPSMGERLVWGQGDGASLVVHDRPYGKISGLNCWEHRMMLPGYALIALGTQIHVSAWPFPYSLDPETGAGLLMARAFALHGACYVIATCALLRPDDAPEEYRELLTGDSLKQGRCAIIAPEGKVIAEAAVGEETILTASVSLKDVLMAKGSIDIGGHYSRPDVLQLMVNRRPLHRLVEMNSPDHILTACGANLTTAELNVEKLHV
jgi:nitrilase